MVRYIYARTSNGKYDFSKMFPFIEKKIKNYDKIEKQYMEILDREV